MRFKRRLNFDDRVRFSRKMGILYLFLFVLFCGFGVGYAVIRSEMKVNGSARVINANWNVHFSGISITQGSVTATTPASITAADTVEFAVPLTNPGDFYEFSVNVVNDGTMNAVLNGITITPVLSASQKEYIEYSLTYDNGSFINNGDLLLNNSSRKVRVIMRYKDNVDVSLYPETDSNYNASITMNYVQTNDSVEPSSFSTDSWETIIAAAQSNNFSSYSIGDTKAIDMGSFGTHNIRIANIENPSECNGNGFSKSACGIVLEFTDIIVRRSMNSTSTNLGGWPATELREYLNTDIYNALPSALKNGIADTLVISGHGNTAGEDNFTSVDKLYLLSLKEVGIESNLDSAKNLTRTLKYYTDHDDSSDLIKGDGTITESWWWLRTPPSNWWGTFAAIYPDGLNQFPNATANDGISPAFRIG